MLICFQKYCTEYDINTHAAIEFYCPPAPTAPLNANSPANRPRIVGTVLSYTCNFGYSGTPSVTCTPYNSSSGYWTAFNDSCKCANFSVILYGDKTKSRGSEIQIKFILHNIFIYFTLQCCVQNYSILYSPFEIMIPIFYIIVPYYKLIFYAMR